MDNENELQDSLTPAESGLEETPLEDLAPQESDTPADDADASVLKEQLAKYKERNQKLFSRAKQAEEIKKKQREELEKYRPKKEEVKNPTPSSIDAREYARLLHQGYSEDEIDFVEKQVKVLGKPASDVLRDEFTLQAIQGVRAKKKAIQSTPTPSNRSSQSVPGKVKHPTYDEWKANRSK